MNKKGFTIVELLVCFVLISVIVIGMLNVVFSYRTKISNTSAEASLVSFKNGLTEDLYTDILGRRVKNVTQLDDRHIEIFFLDNTSKILEMSDTTTINGIRNKSIIYGGRIYDIKENLPTSDENLSDYQTVLFSDNKILLTKDVIGDITLYHIDINIKHTDITGDFGVHLTFRNGEWEKKEDNTAARYIMDLSSTRTDQLRVDSYEPTGQQNFATTEYRYFGSNPDNYIVFNNETWRIIGVFGVDNGEGKVEKRLKIIRNNYITTSAYDTKNTSNWVTSTINTYLNNTYYNSLTATAKEKIAASLYYLGGIDYNITSQDAYNGERGTNIFNNYPTKAISKIALLYPSDFLLATPRTCTAKSGYGVFNISGCYDKDYLYTRNNYWALNSIYFNGVEIGTANFIDATGGVNNYYTTYTGMKIYPTLYLASDVEFLKGTGTSSDPYILK